MVTTIKVGILLQTTNNWFLFSFRPADLSFCEQKRVKERPPKQHTVPFHVLLRTYCVAF